jgi:hypothetical protein
MPEQIKDIQIQRGINDQIAGFQETVITEQARPFLESYDPFKSLLEDQTGRRPYRLMEAMILKPESAIMLRDGIKFIAFSQMARMPQIWKSLCRTETSGRPDELYLRDAAFGTVPKAPSGEQVQFIDRSFEGSATVSNFLYRIGVKVLGDDIKFDRIGVIRQIAENLGRSAMVTEDDAYFTDITTAGNFTRNSTTNDNDVGANTAATTFNALGLDTALTVISTAKDRKSGQYLSYNADTIFAGPKMEFPIKQMLMAPLLVRASDTGAAEVRGMGQYNPYQINTGSLSRIIIHPKFSSSYAWSLVDSTVYSYVWQTVDPWTILQESQVETSEAWLTMNAIRYVLMGYFGHGFVDDRAWYYSSSSTAPTVS